MNTFKKALLVSVCCILCGTPVAIQATIVTFSGVTTNDEVPSDYASHVSADGSAWSVSNGATPNVTLTWSAEAGSAEQRWDFYNDAEWPGVAQMNDTREGTKYWITFTPDSGYGVIFDSFVFDDYVNWEGGSDFSWKLYQDSTNGTVIASGNITTTDGQNLTVNTGMSSAYAGPIVFEIQNNQVDVGEDGSGEALDNISFRQTTITTNEPPATNIINVVFEGELKVFSLNVWVNGSSVSDGVNKVADLVIASDADIVTFVEANSSFLSSLISTLSSKGITNYFSGNLGDRSIISRYPIVETNAVHNSITAFKTMLKPDMPLTVCVAHLDYTHYAVYLPRGYNGGAAPYAGWDMIDDNGDGIPDYVTNITDILNYDLQSTRDEALDAFLTFSSSLTSAGEDVMLLGDFNDCSHLDWTDATKDQFGHQGLVIPWNGSVNLATNGWIDTYRECHPNPLTHPGLTWPSEAFGKGSTSWAPKSDERDRIDYIYYNKQKLNAKNSYVAGSPVYYKFNVKDTLQSDDLFLFAQMPWPSDHKGVVTTFYLDSDGDDMPDSWELSYGLNPTNALDGVQDLDMDQINNHDEFLAGTDPSDPDSFLKISLIKAEADEVIVKWNAVSNRVYSVLWTDSLLKPFQPLQPTRVEWPAHIYTNAIQKVDSSGFYKIEVGFE